MNTQETTNKVAQHLQDNKTAWIWGATVVLGILIIVLIGALTSGNSKDADKTKEEAKTEEVQVENEADMETTKTDEKAPETAPEAPAPVAEEKPAPQTPATVALGPNYTKAKTENAGKTLTFGESCTPSATELKVAKNTLVFLGNEGKSTVSLGLNGKTSSLESSHYDLFFVGGTGSYKVLCNDKETATVVVE